MKDFIAVEGKERYEPRILNSRILSNLESSVALKNLLITKDSHAMVKKWKEFQEHLTDIDVEYIIEGFLITHTEDGRRHLEFLKTLRFYKETLINTGGLAYENLTSLTELANKKADEVILNPIITKNSNTIYFIGEEIKKFNVFLEYYFENLKQYIQRGIPEKDKDALFPEFYDKLIELNKAKEEIATKSTVIITDESDSKVREIEENRVAAIEIAKEIQKQEQEKKEKIEQDNFLAAQQLLQKDEQKQRDFEKARTKSRTLSAKAISDIKIAVKGIFEFHNSEKGDTSSKLTALSKAEEEYKNSLDGKAFSFEGYAEPTEMITDEEKKQIKGYIEAEFAPYKESFQKIIDAEQRAKAAAAERLILQQEAKERREEEQAAAAAKVAKDKAAKDLTALQTAEKAAKDLAAAQAERLRLQQEAEKRRKEELAAAAIELAAKVAQEKAAQDLAAQQAKAKAALKSAGQAAKDLVDREQANTELEQTALVEKEETEAGITFKKEFNLETKDIENLKFLQIECATYKDSLADRKASKNEEGINKKLQAITEIINGLNVCINTLDTNKINKNGLDTTLQMKAQLSTLRERRFKDGFNISSQFWKLLDWLREKLNLSKTTMGIKGVPLSNKLQGMFNKQHENPISEEISSSPRKN